MKLGSSVPLHPDFHKHVYEIAASLSAQQDDLANYYSELLICEYRTHYLTSIDVGGVLAKNDYVHKSYSREANTANVTAAASFNFPGLDIFNGKLKFGVNVSSLVQSVDRYQHNIQNSDIMSIGGPPLTEDVSISTWN